MDDSFADTELIIEALSDAGCDVPVKTTTCGKELFAYLETNNPPDLILLDLNLPGESGLEILKTLKSSEMKNVPVVMMTTSLREEDIRDAYNLHANAYVTKSPDYEKLVDVVRHIHAFWFNAAVHTRHAWKRE